MIHPSAAISAGAQLGAGVHVGPYAVVEDDVAIGDGCSIAAHAVLKRYTRLGARNRIAEHAVIGGEPQDVKFRAQTVSFVEIGDDNLLREGVTIHRGSRPDAVTRIGSGCMLMVGAHVGHDCVVGDQVVLVNNAALAGEVTVGERAFISAGVGVHQFCRVGRNAMIGGLAKVVQDALPFCVTDGNPARARGLNLVGLRRAGFKAPEIAALKEAYRLLYRMVPLNEAIKRMQESPSAAVQELAAFIASGTRGFAHPLGRD